MTSVRRWVIPADDEWHGLDLHGPVLLVATRAEVYVELWTEHDDDAPGRRRWFRIVGTGQPTEGAHVGSAITPSGRLVWHLYERVS